MLKYRADYRPPACKVISAGLDISIHDDRTFVTTTLELERVGDDPFLLNGRDLALHELSIDGSILDEADWPVTEAGLALSACPTNALCGRAPSAIRKATPRWKVSTCPAACTVHSASRKGSAVSASSPTART